MNETHTIKDRGGFCERNGATLPWHTDLLCGLFSEQSRRCASSSRRIDFPVTLDDCCCPSVALLSPKLPNFCRKELNWCSLGLCCLNSACFLALEEVANWLGVFPVSANPNYPPNWTTTLNKNKKKNWISFAIQVTVSRYSTLSRMHRSQIFNRRWQVRLVVMRTNCTVPLWRLVDGRWFFRFGRRRRCFVARFRCAWNVVYFGRHCQRHMWLDLSVRFRAACVHIALIVRIFNSGVHFVWMKNETSSHLLASNDWNSTYLNRPKRLHNANRWVRVVGHAIFVDWFEQWYWPMVLVRWYSCSPLKMKWN